MIDKDYEMPQTRRPGRHEEGARTRERILEAASILIAGQGYAATSIAQISKRAKVNAASIYWAFENKEGLLTAVMERSANSFFDGLSQRVTGDPWQMLADLADDFAAGPEFLRLLLVLSLERRDGDPRVLEAARRIRAKAIDGLALSYESVIDLENQFARRRVCRELAGFTLMLLDGVFVAGQIESSTIDLERSFQTLSLGVRATAERLVLEAMNTTPATSSH